MNYLVIGDGNFSFSLALMKEHNFQLLHLVATSLESYDKVLAHDGAAENIRELKTSRAIVLHGVDGTLLRNHNELRSLGWKFDVIFFNFPHTGGKANIKQNRELLHDFFQSAVGFLTERGEIRLSLCKGQGGTPVDCTKRGYGNSWKVVEIAAEAGLILSGVEPFQPNRHPGYQPTGYRGQSKGFLLEGALTHVFSLSQVDPALAPWRRVTSVCEPCRRCFRNPPAEFPGSLLDRFTARLLHYPLLAQPWHPISLVRQMLEEHLKQPNQLWQSAACLFREQVLVHCSPSDCIPQEVATQHSVGSLSEPTATTGVAGVDEAAKCCQPEARLFCQSLAELEIPSLIRFLKQSVQDSASIVVLSTTPVIRNTPISLSPTEQPITHNMLGVFSLSPTMQDGCCLCDSLEGLLIETVHGVFTQSVLLAPRIQKADLLWSDCSDSICLKKSRELHIKLHADDFLIAQYGTYQYSETPLLFAFVIYLEPIAMAHFGIDDARMFWSRDIRFASQFLMDNPQRASFHPFSIFPPTYTHDISFWNPRRDKDGTTTAVELSELQLASIVRRETQNSVVSMECTDVYQPPHSPSASYCYRLCYRAADTALSRGKALRMQLQLRDALQNDMKIELR